MNTPTKKVAKKIATKKAPVETPTASDLYKVTISFNDNKYTFETNDPSDAIITAKPFFLKTKVIIKIEKDGKTAEKALQPVIARRMWKMPVSFRAMITRLSFK